MSRVEKLKNRFRASLLTQGLAATIALHTTSALLLLGVFLLVQGRALERQLELRGESMAQFLANELPFSLLVGDQGEMRRLLAASAANEDVLFLEVRSPAGQRLCALGRADRIRDIPGAAPPRRDREAGDFHTRCRRAFRGNPRACTGARLRWVARMGAGRRAPANPGCFAHGNLHAETAVVLAPDAIRRGRGAPVWTGGHV